MTESEAAVSSKVEELMNALDQVKRYRALTGLMVDFAIVFLASVSCLLAVELGVNVYRLGSGFPCYIASPASITCTASGVSTNTPLEAIVGLSAVFIPAAGLIIGVYWVDRGLKSVKGGQWKESLKEGFPGALKLLQELKWDAVFEDIRLSKIGYATYFIVKVLGYWMFAIILMTFPYVLLISELHAYPNLYLLAVVSLALVLVMTRGDLQRRYKQLASLDALMWDLRWFSSEFRSARFEA